MGKLIPMRYIKKKGVLSSKIPAKHFASSAQSMKIKNQIKINK